MALTLIAPSRGATQAIPTSIPDVELVRCLPRSGVACLHSIVTFRPGEATRLAGAEATSAVLPWEGSLAGERLAPPGVRIPLAVRPPLHLLVLLDASTSMAGARLEGARSALRGLLADLPDGTVRVAIVPFESRRVSERVRSAVFVPPSEAFVQLDQLPRPARNTAMYSALRAGIDVVDEAVRATPGRTWGGILLITDGRNDAGRPGDDAGLLRGPEGRRTVVDALQQSDVHLWVVGLGNDVDPAELRALAGPRGSLSIVQLDPYSMGRAFAQIEDGIFTAREITFVLPPAVWTRLARGQTSHAVWARVGSDTAAVIGRSLRWRPPLFAMPAFAGAVDSVRLPAAFAGLLDNSELPVDRRWTLLAFFAIFWFLLWLAVPKLLWPLPAVTTGAAAARAARPRREPKPAAAPSAAPTGLRSDVHEVPPRQLTEVTAQTARRVIRKR